MSQHPIHIVPGAKKLNSSALLFIVTALTLLLLGMICYIGIYNHPSAMDDYQYALWDSYSQTQLNLYSIWSGRYFDNLLLPLVPVHWHAFGLYRLVVILSIIVYAIAIFSVVRAALRAYTSLAPRLVYLVATATVLLILNNLPSLVEAFYWYSAMVTYSISFILIAGLLLLFISRSINSEVPPSGLHYCMAIILALSIIGSNETAMVLSDSLCTVLMVYYCKRSSPHLVRFYAILLVCCLAGTAFCIFSPGNFVRQAVTARNLWMVLPSWIYYTQKTAADWMSDPAFLLYSALLLLVFRKYGDLAKPVVPFFVSFLTPLLVFLLMSLPANYALGTLPPPRVHNFIYVFFVLSWIFFLLHFSYHIRANGVSLALPSGKLKPVVIVTLCLFALISINGHPPGQNNYYQVVKNLVRRIPQSYDRELNKRYAFIQASTNDTVVVAPLTTTKDNLLFYIDIAPTPYTRTSIYYARYWNKSMIYAPPDSSISR